jgi:hypothetical protein
MNFWPPSCRSPSVRLKLPDDHDVCQTRDRIAAQGTPGTLVVEGSGFSLASRIGADGIDAVGMAMRMISADVWSRVTMHDSLLQISKAPIFLAWCAARSYFASDVVAISEIR